MLKRLYADNFRCLENFEIRFGESNLLLGRNGTGKTSVLDVLRKIQDLVVRGQKVDQVFPRPTCPRIICGTSKGSRSTPNPRTIATHTA